MRVLLLSTPYPLSESVTPPLGLAYIGACLEQEGVDVQILDFLVSKYTPSRLRQTLEEFRPQIVGATCVTLSYKVAARMLKVCKDFDPRIMTVIGGPHVTFVPELTLRRAPWIDAVVIGEADLTVRDLVRVTDGGGDLDQVAGIAFARDGVVMRTERRQFVSDLDQLPMPARHLLPMARYSALKSPCTVITSRGCPFSCIFCSANGIFGRKVRLRDPGLVVDEIEMLDRDYDFIQINIVDDTFTVNHDHARRVCDEILRRNLKVKWSAYARVDTMEKELLRLMRRAGCVWVLFGVESADPDILRTIRKGITIEEVRAASRMATDAGLKVFNSFIFGLPGESPDTIRKSRALAHELSHQYGAAYGFHVLSPLPGTRLHDRAEDYGIRLLTRDWNRYDANQVITETQFMSAEMLKGAISAYDNEMESAREYIRSQAASGDRECIDRLRGDEQQSFVWQLLKGDVIEKLGWVVTSCDSREHAEVELAQRVSHKLGLPFDMVRRQIEGLADDGFLRLEKERTASGGSGGGEFEPVL